LVDERYVTVAGRWTYPYRAIDQHSQVIDIRLFVERDLAAERGVLQPGTRLGR
jgi:transposase-like protein